MNTNIKIDKLSKYQMELIKLLRISYSPRREEIYINDFNNEMLCKIDLYDYDDDFMYFKNKFILNGDTIDQNILTCFESEIIDILIDKYFGTALENGIRFSKTFSIDNIPSSFGDDFLYAVYFDYTYMLVFANDEDDALVYCSEKLIESGYDDCTEDSVLYNAVVKIESRL